MDAPDYIALGLALAVVAVFIGGVIMEHIRWKRRHRIQTKFQGKHRL